MSFSKGIANQKNKFMNNNKKLKNMNNKYKVKMKL